MKRAIVAAIFFVVTSISAEPVKKSPATFDFRGVGVSQVVQLIYAEALHDGYVIDPEVLNDSRPVSFRFDGTRGDVQKFIPTFFDSIGLTVTRRDGVDYITKKKAQDARQDENEVFVYFPKFRDGSYLSDLLGPLFKGSFTVRHGVHAALGDKSPQQAVPPGSAAAQVDRQADTLVFSGAAIEISRLKKILDQVDVAVGEVLVRAVLYEVSSSEKDGSAFSLALNLLNGKLGLSTGSANPLETFVRFKNQSIDAVFSALSNDSRFKVVSRPSLRVRSGNSGRFTVGQDVPVLGSVSYPGNGQPAVQSVEYRSSGVIFELQPQVRESVVDLNISQQVSNFVTTDTGVNNSPTLIKRELKTVLSLADSDVVVLGGLAENKDSQGSSGFSFLPAFLKGSTRESSRSEILLIIQLIRM
jgi:general secretion pathway protein D